MRLQLALSVAIQTCLLARLHVKSYGGVLTRKADAGGARCHKFFAVEKHWPAWGGRILDFSKNSVIDHRTLSHIITSTSEDISGNNEMGFSLVRLVVVVLALSASADAFAAVTSKPFMAHHRTQKDKPKLILITGTSARNAQTFCYPA
jgi:hypothetical protein